MSLFDNDLVERNLPLRNDSGSLSEFYFKSACCFRAQGSEMLSNKELLELIRALTFRFEEGQIQTEIKGITWYKAQKNDVEIVIMDASPKYEENNRRGKDILRLGAYLPSSMTIELYIKNIRAASTDKGIPSAALLVYVFAHEMYHAFFHGSNPSGVNNPYIEEPLAEYGALLFSCAFLEPSKFEGILSFVEDKQDGLPHYALGATLFKKVDLPSSVVIPYLNVRDKSFSGKSEQVVEYVNMVKQGELLCARDTLLNLLK